MDLGYAFARRKQIQAEVQQWINRLALAGKDTYMYQVETLDGDKEKKLIPGTKKEYHRNYTIEEAQAKITGLLNEDRIIARRISLTNQIAKVKIIDLDGEEKVMTIPELLILRNEIAPKLEEAARAIPKLTVGVDVIDRTPTYIKWREIGPIVKYAEKISEGFKITEEYVKAYNITEYVDYGKPEREIADQIDQIHEWLTRIKTAINTANKTELIS